jgi:ribonuclease VapC
VKTRVLDSWAILEWIAAKQPAFDLVDKLLSEAEEGQIRLLMSVINAGEVYYFLRKQHSFSLSESWRESARTLPATIDVPTGEDTWNAALLKVQFPISYADAFAAALAQKCNCPLVTGDADFRSVDQLELDWIGAKGRRS